MILKIFNHFSKKNTLIWHWAFSIWHSSDSSINWNLKLHRHKKSAAKQAALVVFSVSVQALADPAGDDLGHGQLGLLGSFHAQAATAAGKNKCKRKGQQHCSPVAGGKIVVHSGTSFSDNTRTF
jgi:autotransporter adhesin